MQGTAHTSLENVAREVELVRNSGDPALEPASPAAEVVYAKWLEASSMPVKADIKKILSEHGLLITEGVHDAQLMPEPAETLRRRQLPRYNRMLLRGEFSIAESCYADILNCYLSSAK